MVQVIFLGTAGSSAVASKNLRASGGFVIRAGEFQLHVDPGPGSLSRAKEFNVNPNHTTAVFVTHNHLNHCNDLNVVIEAMTHSGLEQRGIVMGSKSTLQSYEGNSPVLTKYHQSLVERILPLEKNHKVGIDAIEIHAIPIEHSDPTAIGLKFICQGAVIGYPGDTIYSESLTESLYGSDILILNVPYPGEKAQGLNLDTSSAAKIVAMVKPKMAIITHFGLEMIKANPIFEARAIQQATGVQTIAATDGLTISPSALVNYSPVKGY